jgi:phage terminase small subunit
MKTLRPKQKRFCEEYLVDFNATQAAIRAGYSKRTAAEISYEHLRKPHIQAYIQKLTQKLTDKAEITIESTLADLAKVRSKALEEKTYSPAIALKALELQGKYLKMFTDKVEHTGADGKPIETKYTVEFVKAKGRDDKDNQCRREKKN